jgi:hypothetical protein
MSVDQRNIKSCGILMSSVCEYIQNTHPFVKNSYLPRYNSEVVTCFHAGFLIGLFFDPEDRGDMLL